MSHTFCAPLVGAVEMTYVLGRFQEVEKGAWDDSVWGQQPAVSISHVLSQTTSPSPPTTQAKVLYSDRGLLLFFRVQNEHGVLRRFATYQDPVYKDSCVEFFVQPKEGAGYFNFEMNSLGTLLLSFVTIEKGERKTTPLPSHVGALVQVLDQGMTQNFDLSYNWHVQYFIPYKVFEAYVDVNLQTVWHGNFYKCCDDSPHPHWVSWSPIANQELNFHQPSYFGKLVFEEMLDKFRIC